MGDCDLLSLMGELGKGRRTNSNTIRVTTRRGSILEIRTTTTPDHTNVQMTGHKSKLATPIPIHLPFQFVNPQSPARGPQSPSAPDHPTNLPLPHPQSPASPPKPLAKKTTSPTPTPPPKPKTPLPSKTSLPSKAHPTAWCAASTSSASALGATGRGTERLLRESSMRWCRRW